MKTYAVGEIELTQQALIVFVVAVAVALISLIALRKNPKMAAIAFISFLAVGSYTTYLTNCTVVGKCEKLAWFLVAMNILSAFIIVPLRYKMLRNIKI
jgi:hypothetical protein